ncbi:hypothetical protein CSUB01_11608 [Colletotrichum sublineola]|uniref:Uncharacterized protein n=1 Tax=Colletotrichum sublineola TaxID=1173701 RepID=A0A066WUT8_COLSU|nr:hypothetical protein CSUB01_11608 [Colletotrichum sublineola]
MVVIPSSVRPIAPYHPANGSLTSSKTTSRPPEMIEGLAARVAFVSEICDAAWGPAMSCQLAGKTRSKQSTERNSDSQCVKNPLQGRSQGCGQCQEAREAETFEEWRGDAEAEEAGGRSKAPRRTAYATTAAAATSESRRGIDGVLYVVKSRAVIWLVVCFGVLVAVIVLLGVFVALLG